MIKPAALSDADLADIEQRIVKGWVIRRDQMAALIAMARERNYIVRSHHEQQASIGGMLQGSLI